MLVKDVKGDKILINESNVNRYKEKLETGIIMIEGKNILQMPGVVYLEPSEGPLSANVICIQGKDAIWFYDVGNGEQAVTYIQEHSGPKRVILSHFHPDHSGSLKNITYETLYVSKHTYGYTHQGIIVEQDLYLEDGMKFHVFPLPSSHAKGCLGLEIDETVAFLGDAIYATRKEERVVYNAQHLRELIDALNNCKAKYFAVSHREPFVTDREEILQQMEDIYHQREKNSPWIVIH